MAQQGKNEMYVKPSQVLFIIGKDRTRCVGLRGLLAISSPIFRQMLTDNHQKDMGNQIELIDVDAEAFALMLSHIEGSDIKKKLTVGNMCNILYLSIKYMLPKLTSVASKFVKKSLNKANIFKLYQLAQALDDDHIRQLIWNWLGRKSSKTSDPIINAIFLSLSGQEIAILLQKPYISIEEERIFIFCLNWLKAQYQKNDTNPMATARDICRPFINYIRFPLMSHKFLTTDVYFTGILSNDELIHIYRAKTLRDQKLTAFTIEKRKALRSKRDAHPSAVNARAMGRFGPLLNRLINDQEQLQHREESDNESDDEFDSVNMNESDTDEEDEEDKEEDEEEEGEEVTSKISAVLCSSQYSGDYGVQNMYNDDASYWASTALQSNKDEFIVFDCGEYKIRKIAVKFPVEEGACSSVKVYSSENSKHLRNPKLRDWDKITKKVNMPKNGNIVQNIKIRNDDVCRYLLVKFEDGQNGYAGVQRIRFYV
eukprot:304256_1